MYDYLRESYLEQFNHETTVKRDLDLLVKEAHQYFNGSKYYTKQYNFLLKKMLEGTKFNMFNARDLGYQTMDMITEGTASRINEINKKIWNYIRENIDSPSRRHAYSEWYRNFNESYTILEATVEEFKTFQAKLNEIINQGGDKEQARIKLEELKATMLSYKLKDLEFFAKKLGGSHTMMQKLYKNAAEEVKKQMVVNIISNYVFKNINESCVTYSIKNLNEATDEEDDRSTLSNKESILPLDLTVERVYSTDRTSPRGYKYSSVLLFSEKIGYVIWNTSFRPDIFEEKQRNKDYKIRILIRKPIVIKRGEFPDSGRPFTKIKVKRFKDNISLFINEQQFDSEYSFRPRPS